MRLIIYSILFNFAYNAFAEETKIYIMEMEPIVVTATRTPKKLSEAPVNTKVIGREEIKNSGAQNLGDILNTQTGMEVSQSTMSGSSLEIEGLSPEYVLVLVDGQRITGRIAGAVDLSRFPAENIDHIEVVRGSGSALYGSDAMAGVVNIITRKTKKPFEAEVESIYGNLNALDTNARIGVRNKFASTNLSTGFHRRDSYDLDESDPGTTGRSFDEFHLATNSNFQTSDKLNFLASSDYLLRNQVGISATSEWPVFDDTKKTQTFSATLGPEYEISDTARFTFFTHYSLYKDEYVQDMRDSDLLDSEDNTFEQIGEITIQYDQLLPGNHLLTSGSELSHEELETDRLETGRNDRQRGAIFLQDEWTVFHKRLFTIMPGMRFDEDSQFGEALSPKIALRYDPIKSVTLRTDYGRGFRAPSFKELYIVFENLASGYRVEGNSELEPERSHNARFNLDYHPWQWFNYEAILFYNKIENLISTDYLGSEGGTTSYSYTNISSAYTRGVENSISLKLLKYVKIQIGYNYLDTMDNETGKPLEGRSRHSATASTTFTWAKQGLIANIRTQVFGERPYYRDEGTVYARPYTLLSSRITKSVGSHMDIFTGGDNLLDSGDPDYVPIEPLTVYGGVRFKY